MIKDLKERLRKKIFLISSIPRQSRVWEHFGKFTGLSRKFRDWLVLYLERIRFKRQNLVAIYTSSSSTSISVSFTWNGSPPRHCSPPLSPFRENRGISFPFLSNCTRESRSFFEWTSILRNRAELVKENTYVCNKIKISNQHEVKVKNN